MSDPDVTKAVLTALKRVGTASASSPRGLQDKLELSHFSFNQFWKAVRSLRYKPNEQRIRLERWGSRDAGTRMWSVAPL